MSDQSNNPITSDQTAKALAYSDALNKLKASIDGVNSKLPEFADGMKAGLIALGEKLPEVVNAIQDLNKQNKELAASGQQPKSVIKELASAFLSWNSALSVGITLIATYGPQVLSFLGNLFNSEKARAAAQALKDYSDVMETYTQNISKQKGEYQVLLSVAKNTKLADDTRIEAIKKLNALSPDHLKTLSLSNILTKEGSTAIDEYVKALKRKAVEEAAQPKMTELVKERMDITEEYQEAKKEVERYRKGRANDPNFGIKITSNNGSAVGTTTTTDYLEIAEKKYKAMIDKDKAIIQRINSVDNTVAQQLQGLAPKVQTPQKLTGKAYWLSILSEQQNALDALDAGSKNFETKSKPIIKRIKAIQKTLSNYSVNEVKSPGKKPEVIHPTKEELAAAEKAYQDFQIKQLQDTANGLAKKIESQKNSYTEEQATLKRLYDNKLLSQEDYSKESQQLEEKYHIGLGEIVKRMDADELAKVHQQQKDLVDAQQQKELLGKDQHNVDKALPWNKLEAEKQLITDKYNFEIQKAAEAGKDTAEIRLQYEQAITDATKKNEQDRKDFALKAAQQISDKAFSIIGNNIKSSSDAKIKGLEQDKAAELSNKSLTATQRKAIEAKYQKQEAAEKVKAFKAEQKASILQAVVNGALAITKVTSQSGMLAPLVIPGIIASTAIQVATIAAQKAPQYAKGGLHYQSDGRGALLSGYSRTDNTNAYLRSGEAVVVSEAMRNPWARNLVSAINVAHGGRDFSVPNTGSGYAIGGIFTDGGNANRYYNQPVNDVKDMANTLAYQMINNFPPIYVDVKDVNNQQNILAQTVNRVNL